MDKTKEFILMSEKAEEIQKEWKIQEGDCFYNKNWKKISCYTPMSGYQPGRYSENIWLPTQAQLQGMIIELYENQAQADDYQIRYKREVLNWMINSFDGFVYQNKGKAYKSDKSFPDNLISMEQLWLAFVMKEKYNKKWNGKEWEKSK